MVSPDLVLTLGSQYSRSDVDGFWHAWSKGAEEALFQTYCRVGGPTTAESTLFFDRRAVRFRRLGGKSVGGGRGTGASRLYRASQGAVVDASSAQFFVNSSLAPVLLFRRRLQSVADVLKCIRQRGFTQARWVRVLGSCVSSRPWWAWSPGWGGFPRIFTASTNGSLTLLGWIMILLSRWLLTVPRSLGYSLGEKVCCWRFGWVGLE